MKFDVTFKDPDSLQDSIRDAVEKQIREVGITDEDEIEALSETRRKKVSELCQKWFQYGEYLTVEVDTDAKTCVVCPLK